jgi:hypothetical protein
MKLKHERTAINRRTVSLWRNGIRCCLCLQRASQALSLDKDSTRSARQETTEGVIPLLSPTTIEHNPAYYRHAVPLAEPEQRGHVVQEGLGGHVQAAPDGTPLIVGSPDVNKERARVQQVAENIGLHE